MGKKNVIQLRIYFFTRNDVPKRLARSENEVERRKKGKPFNSFASWTLNIANVTMVNQKHKKDDRKRV